MPRVCSGFARSTPALSGVGVEPRKFDGKGDVELYIRQFELIRAVNGWSDSLSLVMLHHSLTGNAISCGRHDTNDDTIRDLRVRFGCQKREASHRLFTLRQGSMSLHHLGDEVHRLADIVYGFRKE